MATEPGHVDATAGPGRFRFGDVVVDAAAHTVVRAGEPQALEPKAFAVLLALLRRPGELVARDELLDAVWGHRHVTPGVLTRAVAQLRTALGDDPHHPRYIRTQHALGYGFVGELLPDVADAPPAAPASTVNVTPPPRDPRAVGGDRRRAPPARTGPRVLLALLALLVATVWWTATQRARPVPTEASVAVLPFATLGGGDDERWFAEGLALEMLGALSGVDGITVAAWRPADAIDRRLPPAELARELGVATLLDATVRREGGRLRISARLSDARTGLTVWSETYDREAASVFDTQTAIASEVARALLGVLPDAGAGLRHRLAPTRDVAAYDDYLRGLHALLAPAEAADAGTAHFRAALARDPGFARAQAGLCRLEVWRFHAQQNPDAFENAKRACLRAANMDPGIGPVQLALGDLHRVQGPPEKALEYYALAASDRSVRPRALAGRAGVLADRGDADAAIAAFREALALAPDDAGIHASLGYQEFLDGRLPEARASLKRATELDPGDAWLWATYGGVLLSGGDEPAAVDAFERSRAIEPIDSVISNLGTLRYQAGDYAAAAARYREALALNDSNAAIWGSLGDALAADPATAGEAAAAYREAATRGEAYVAVETRDAKALATLAWFVANLGEADRARALVARAEALERQPGEVALYAALVAARLGDAGLARSRLAAARAAGIGERRIATHAALRAVDTATPAGGSGPPSPTNPRAAGASSRGAKP